MPLHGADTFVHLQAPGANVQNFLNAYEQTSSLMERKQRLAMAQEDQDMQRAEFQAKLPVIQAEAGLRIANAATAITTAASMAQRETEAAQAWGGPDGYNEKFQNILQTIHDPKEQSDALQQLQGEVAWTKQFKSYAPGVDAVNNARASAFTLAITNLKLDNHLEETQAQLAARQKAVETTVAGRESTASTRADSQQRIAAINADTRLSVEEKRAQKSTIGIDNLMAKVSESDQLAADAQAAGNDQEAEAHRRAAAIYRDQLTKTTTFAGSSPSDPRTKEQDVRPTPKPAPGSSSSGPPIVFKMPGSSASKEDNSDAIKQVGADWSEVTLPSGAKVRVRKKQ